MESNAVYLGILTEDYFNQKEVIIENTLPTVRHSALQ